MGVSGSSVAPLRPAQKAAARLWTGTRKLELMTLSQLHLPGCTATPQFTRKWLYLLWKPQRSSELLHPSTPSRALWSAEQLLLKATPLIQRAPTLLAFSRYFLGLRTWCNVYFDVQEAGNLCVCLNCAIEIKWFESEWMRHRYLQSWEVLVTCEHWLIGHGSMKWQQW